MTSRMPAAFIGHGTPMQALQDNGFTRGWAAIGELIPRPELILCISAHWLSRGEVLLTGNPQPPVIYDMGGFPEALYQVQYPACGAPAFAQQIADSLTSVEASVSSDWGLDHGTWVVLKHMFPAADIPVVQLSVCYDMPEQQHFILGRELAALREQGVFVMGSGQFVHNLRQIIRPIDEPAAFPWASKFSQVVSQWVGDRDFDRVVRFRELGELARLAHPTHEHFLPLLPILGMAESDDELRWINATITGGSVDMRSLLLMPGATE